MMVRLNCNSTSNEIENKYSALKFEIYKHSLIISFCDQFGTIIDESEISSDDAIKLAKTIITITN